LRLLSINLTLFKKKTKPSSKSVFKGENKVGSEGYLAPKEI